MNDDQKKSSHQHAAKSITPMFSRQDLEVLASGKISSIFGDQFVKQDQYSRQVRMPQPPLLLADRVMSIEGEPCSMSKGIIVTETDVVADAWYMHERRMPPGIMIESGQADLLLISWMGVDFYNQGERIYRLLGCDLTFYEGLAKPGEILHYEIHLDGIAKHGDIRLMFFHYDCTVNGQLRMRVRNGQAGFFTDAELAESKGVLWDAQHADFTQSPQLDSAIVECQRKSFNYEQISAFANGNGYQCFGPGFEYLQTHNHSPRIQADQMLFLHEITEFNPRGGPDQRGYIRALQRVTPEDWFFTGHFKNDPCMPGTLMAEAGFQLLSFYLAALGFTIDKDGWRFEPVVDEKMLMRCRGQCIPSSKEVIYELFIDEVVAEPWPTIYVELLASVDGLKAFYAHRFGIRLVPDWPLSRHSELLLAHESSQPVAQSGDFKFDYQAMIACAWGQPSKAFGPFYKKFDRGLKVPRLPGPPYHQISRIVAIDSEIGLMKSGVNAVAEYDVPPDAWYFRENNNGTMPFSILMEIGLQPCGWLASYVGSALTVDEQLFFRNLDGTGTIHADVFPDAGCLRTELTITNIARLGTMILTQFEVKVLQQQTCVFSMNTGFGFFPGEAFQNQAGLPVGDDLKQQLLAPCEFSVDLTQQPSSYFTAPCCLADPMLLMIDRITGYWPEGGKNKLGFIRAEKTVNPDEWFFKAHFYRDPVQPGSLGVEAICQTLQFYMIQENMAANIDYPYFRSVGLEHALTWKYRGQVVPRNKIITITMDIIDKGMAKQGAYAVADASLWVDGKRIYQVDKLLMQIISREVK